ncbi:hypothetical protein IE81DRAFT_30352 [Ceraceosorus guamensis]|uniref:RING-type domain-containing protein n=1 Tax=Ceraceosorus guamensis TaxID=1522189 RepID=A0A316W5I4_9BASI|nr:hypothetical protein IE81DRAFT_30352 [Ceraceosorus guamensis]PWN44328.1 hypothetical protein IE81DRAFT_30352 [Ceraceosorus guamensis]
MNVGFGGQSQAEAEPQPDPKATESFVASLERADAELRSRMARLELGDIGTGNVGCAICLEEYDAEDRPEWIAGSAARDHECVVVPCGGFHTLHASCLQEWFSAKPPNEWACPFCRESLAPKKFVKGRVVELPRAKLGVGLREDVRRRERQQGWRCDSPACLPEYPEDQNGAEKDHEREQLLKLKPCGHEHHLDCLTMAMRLDNPFATCEDEEDDGDACVWDGISDPSRSASSASGVTSSPAASESLKDQEASEMAESAPTASTKNVDEAPALSVPNSEGKWVTCPKCRHEAWAALPRRRRKRAASSQEQGEATQLPRR